MVSNKGGVISFYYKHKPGGFTKRLYKVYMVLAQEGYDVHYFSMETLPVEHPNIHRHLVEVNTGQNEWLLWPMYFIKSVFAARSLWKKIDIKGYVVFSFFYAVLSVFSMQRSNKLWVFIRGDDVYDSQFKSFPRLRAAVHRLLEFIGMNASNKVICTNKRLMQSLINRGCEEERLYYLPNNIPTVSVVSGERESSSDCIWKFATASVLNPRKEQLLILKALSLVSSKNWSYQLIGADVENTGYERILREYVKEQGMESNVHFLGWRNDVSELISQCDLFLFSTSHEGSPNALLEALGVGVACMGSDIPEVAEILKYPELTFSNDSPEELSEKLDRYICSDSYRKGVLEQTSMCKSEFDFDWGERLLQLIEVDEGK